MILWNKLSLIILLCGLNAVCFGQNLLDQNNTAQFADFLFKTRQFKYSAQEYERLHFMDQSNEEYKLFLIRSYRLDNALSLAESRLNSLYGDSICDISKAVFKELMAIQFDKEDFTSARNYLECNKKIDEYSYSYYQVSISLLSRNYTEAKSQVTHSPRLAKPFGAIIAEADAAKYKSPALAASLSAIIPGTGKIYSGHWKDGLIAFVFVATNVFQAYRGFSLYGTDSAHGWVFGGLAIGFYTGNILGSAKSASKHNRLIDDKIHMHAKDIIFTDLD